MHPKTFSTTKIPFNPNFIFIIFTLTICPLTQCQDPKFKACAPQSCGNLPSIRYPFWIPNNQPSYCGHQTLNITCKDNRTAILEISPNDYYIITHIDYSNHTFHLANSLLFDDKVPCPTPMHNITLDKTLLNFSNDHAEFFLFYNCSSLPKEFNILYNISCVRSDAKHKSFGDFHGEFLEVFRYSPRMCQAVVVAPVDVVVGDGQGDEDPSSSLLKMNYKEILRQGFTLSWSNEHDCGACEKSGGRCGVDDHGKFVCFCWDKPYSQSCHNGKDKKKSGIIIGAGIAGASTAVLMCVLCFLYTHRHRLRNRSALPAYLIKKRGSNTSYSSANSDLRSFNGSAYFGVQLFSYRELEKASDFFSPSKELGEGGFGTVYYAKLGDGREVAIKRLYENNTKRAEQFMNEVQILAHLRHKNLVTLYGCTSRQSRELLLVYEYVPNGTVADHLYGCQKANSPLAWATRLSIAVETARALLYLHASDIIHRDVKTQNILLDRDFSVKVADFGLSRLFPLDVTHVSTAPQGTPGYVDPEYHQVYQLTEKSDVYSFGVVLAELVSSKPAVDITRKRQEINLSNMAIDKIQNNALHELVDPCLGFETNPKVKKEITAVAEMAFRCLQGTKDMRPSMEEVLETLLEIQGNNQNDKVDKAEVVDISDDYMGSSKSGLSPGSTRADENSVGRHVHTSC